MPTWVAWHAIVDSRRWPARAKAATRRDAGWWLVPVIALVPVVVPSGLDGAGWVMKRALLVAVAPRRAPASPRVALLVATATRPGLWLTADQRGDRLLREGKPPEAAKVYADPMRRGAALYRAGEFEEAAKAFATVAGADAAFDRGDALADARQVPRRGECVRRALELRPGWKEAEENRALALARDKLLHPTGDRTGTGGQLKPDEIVFDKNEVEEHDRQRGRDRGRQADRRGTARPVAAPRADEAGRLPPRQVRLPGPDRARRGAMNAACSWSLVLAQKPDRWIWSRAGSRRRATCGSASASRSSSSCTRRRSSPARQRSTCRGAQRGDRPAGRVGRRFDSEAVGDDTYTVQRHELAVYPQRAGTVRLPPIRVRFASDGGIGKPPVPRQGATQGD